MSTLDVVSKNVFVKCVLQCFNGTIIHIHLYTRDLLSFEARASSGSLLAARLRHETAEAESHPCIAVRRGIVTVRARVVGYSIQRLPRRPTVSGDWPEALNAAGCPFYAPSPVLLTDDAPLHSMKPAEFRVKASHERHESLTARRLIQQVTLGHHTQP